MSDRHTGKTAPPLHPAQIRTVVGDELSTGEVTSDLERVRKADTADDPVTRQRSEAILEHLAEDMIGRRGTEAAALKARISEEIEARSRSAFSSDRWPR